MSSFSKNRSFNGDLSLIEKRINNSYYLPFTNCQKQKDCYTLKQSQMKTLDQFLSENSTNDFICLKNASRVLSFLEYLNKENLFHGHLTGNNILFDEKFNAFITDYSSYKIESDFNKYISTHKSQENYIAPECIKGQKPTFESDKFSFGVLAQKLLEKTKVGKEKELEDIINKCTSLQPENRPRIEEIREVLNKTLNTCHFTEPKVLEELPELISMIINNAKENIGILNPKDYNDSLIEGFGYVLTEEAKMRLTKLERYIENNVPVLLEGQTGTSKTFSVEVICKILVKPLTRFNLSSEMRISDLMGKYVSDSNSSGGIAFEPGPYYKCYTNGGCLLLDEINLASSSVLQCIEASLDMGFLSVELSGRPLEKKKRNPNFCLVATQNPNKGLFSNKRQDLTQKFISHFQPISFPDFSKKELIEIARKLSQNSKCEILKKNIVKFVEFHLDCLNWAKENKDSNTKSIQYFTLREISATIASAENKNLYNVVLFIYGSRYKEEKRKELMEMFSKKFPTVEKIKFDSFKDESCYINNNFLFAMNSIKFSLNNKRNVLITGEKGCGKTQLAKWIPSFLGRNKKDYYYGICTPDIKCSDLIGKQTIKSGKEEEGFLALKIEWTDGFLTKGIKDGKIVILDHLEEAPSTISERLNGLLEIKYNNSKRYFDIPENPHEPKIIIKDEFHLICICDYENLDMISPAFLNRFNIVVLENQLPKKKEEIENLMSILIQNNLDINQSKNEDDPLKNIGEIDLENDEEEPNDQQSEEIEQQNQNEQNNQHNLNITDQLNNLSKDIINEAIKFYKEDLVKESLYSVSFFCKAYIKFILFFYPHIQTMNLKTIAKFTYNLLYTDNEIDKNIQNILLDEQSKTEQSFFFRDSPTLKDFMSKVFAASLINLHLIVDGPPGIGKTSSAKAFSEIKSNYLLAHNEILKVENKRQYILQSFHYSLRPSDILGVFQMKNNQIKFEKGTLSSAAENGIVFIADEMNLSPESTMNSIVPLLEPIYDEDVYIPGIEGATIVNKNFFFIACQNEQNVSGRNQVPKRIISRTKHLSYPNFLKENINKQIQNDLNFVFHNISIKIANDYQVNTTLQRKEIEKLMNIFRYINNIHSSKGIVRPWSIRDIKKIFKRVYYQKSVQDNYKGIELYHNILYYIMSSLPREEFEIIRYDILSAIGHSFILEKGKVNKLNELINLDVVLTDHKSLKKGDCEIMLNKQDDKNFKSWKIFNIKLKSLLEGMFRVKLCSPKEAILLIGPSGFKTFLLKQLYDKNLKEVSLNPEANLEQLLGQYKFFREESKNESKLFYLQIIKQFLFWGDDKLNDYENNFKGGNSEEIKEALNKIENEINIYCAQTRSNLKFAAKTVYNKLNQIEENEKNIKSPISKIIIELNPGLILQSILFRKNFIFKHISNVPTKVLERFNEFFSEEPLLSLNEDYYNTFTDDSHRIFDLNKDDNLIRLATCQLGKESKLSEAFLSRATLIYVSGYDEEEQKILTYNFGTNLSNINNDNLKEVINFSKKYTYHLSLFQILNILQIWNKLNEKNAEQKEKNLNYTLYQISKGFLDQEESQIIKDLKLENYIQKGNTLKFENSSDGKKYLSSSITNLRIESHNSQINTTFSKDIAFTNSFIRIVEALYFGIYAHVPVIFEGLPGQGKKTAINYIANLLGYEVENIYISKGTKVENLLLTKNIDLNQSKYEVHYSELGRWIQTPSKKKRIVVFYDIENASPAVIEFLNCLFSYTENEIPFPDGSTQKKKREEMNIVGIINSQHGYLTEERLPNSLLHSSILHKIDINSEEEIKEIILKIFGDNNYHEQFISNYLETKKIASDFDELFTLNDVNNYSSFLKILNSSFDENDLFQMIFLSKFKSKEARTKIINERKLQPKPLIPIIEVTREFNLSFKSNKGDVNPFYMKRKGRGQINFNEQSLKNLTDSQRLCLLFLSLNIKNQRISIIQGDNASGKTYIVNVFAKLNCMRLHIYQMNSDTGIEILANQFHLKEKDKDTRNDDRISLENPQSMNQIFLKKKSAFLNAMENGEWVLIDGIESAPQIAERLSYLIGKKEEFYLMELGESKIKIHQNFHLFITYNYTTNRNQKLAPTLTSNIATFTLEPIDLKIKDSARIIACSLFQPPENSSIQFPLDIAESIGKKMATIHRGAQIRSIEDKEGFAGNIEFNGRYLKFIADINQRILNNKEFSIKEISDKIALEINIFYLGSLNPMNIKYFKKELENLMELPELEEDLCLDDSKDYKIVMTELSKIKDSLRSNDSELDFRDLILKILNVQIKFLHNVLQKIEEILTEIKEKFIEHKRENQFLLMIIHKIIFQIVNGKNDLEDQDSIKTLRGIYIPEKNNNITFPLVRLSFLPKILQNDLKIIPKNYYILEYFLPSMKLKQNNLNNFTEILQSFDKIPSINSDFIQQILNPKIQKDKNKGSILILILKMLSKKNKNTIKMKGKEVINSVKNKNAKIHITIDLEEQKVETIEIKHAIIKIGNKEYDLEKLIKEKFISIEMSNFYYYFIDTFLEQKTINVHIMKSILENAKRKKNDRPSLPKIPMFSTSSIFPQNSRLSPMKRLFTLIFYFKIEDLEIIKDYITPIESKLLILLIKRLHGVSKLENCKQLIDLLESFNFLNEKTTIWENYPELSREYCSYSIDQSEQEIKKIESEIANFQKIGTQVTTKEFNCTSFIKNLKLKKEYFQNIIKSTEGIRERLDLKREFVILQNKILNQSEEESPIVKKIEEILKNYDNYKLEDLKKLYQRLESYDKGTKTFKNAINSIEWPSFHPKLLSLDLEQNSQDSKLIEILIWYSEIFSIYEKIQNTKEQNQRLELIWHLNDYPRVSSSFKYLFSEFMEDKPNEDESIRIAKSMTNAEFIKRLQEENLIDQINSLEKFLDKLSSGKNTIKYNISFIEEKARTSPKDFFLILPVFNPIDILFMFINFSSKTEYIQGPFTADKKKDELVNLNKLRDITGSDLSCWDKILNKIKEKLNNPQNLMQNENLLKFTKGIIDKISKQDSSSINYDDVKIFREKDSVDSIDQDWIDKYPFTYFYLLENKKLFGEFKEIEKNNHYDSKEKGIPFWLFCLRIFSSISFIYFSSNHIYSPSNLELKLNDIFIKLLDDQIQKSEIMKTNWLHLILSPEKLKSINKNNQKNLLKYIYTLLNNIVTDLSKSNHKDEKHEEYQFEALKEFITTVLKKIFTNEIDDNIKSLPFFANPNNVVREKMIRKINETLNTIKNSQEFKDLNKIISSSNLETKWNTFITRLNKDKPGASENYKKFLKQNLELNRKEKIKEKGAKNSIEINFGDQIYNVNPMFNLGNSKIREQDLLNIIQRAINKVGEVKSFIDTFEDSINNQKSLPYLNEEINLASQNISITFVDGIKEKPFEKSQKCLNELTSQFLSFLERYNNFYNLFQEKYKDIENLIQKLPMPFEYDYSLKILLPKPSSQTVSFSKLNPTSNFLSQTIIYQNSNKEIICSFESISIDFGLIYPSLYQDPVSVNFIYLIKQKGTVKIKYTKNIKNISIFEKNTYEISDSTKNPIKIKFPKIKEDQLTEEKYSINCEFQFISENLKPLKLKATINFSTAPLNFLISCQQYDLIYSKDKHCLFLQTLYIHYNQDILFKLKGPKLPRPKIFEKTFVTDKDKPIVAIDSIKNQFSIKFPKTDRQLSSFKFEISITNNFIVPLIIENITFIDYDFWLLCYDFETEQFKRENISVSKKSDLITLHFKIIGVDGMKYNNTIQFTCLNDKSEFEFVNEENINELNSNIFSKSIDFDVEVKIKSSDLDQLTFELKLNSLSKKIIVNLLNSLEENDIKQNIDPQIESEIQKSKEQFNKLNSSKRNVEKGEIEGEEFLIFENKNVQIKNRNDEGDSFRERGQSILKESLPSNKMDIQSNSIVLPNISSIPKTLNEYEDFLDNCLKCAQKLPYYTKIAVQQSDENKIKEAEQNYLTLFSIASQFTSESHSIFAKKIEEFLIELFKCIELLSSAKADLGKEKLEQQKKIIKPVSISNLFDQMIVMPIERFTQNLYCFSFNFSEPKVSTSNSILKIIEEHKNVQKTTENKIPRYPEKKQDENLKEDNIKPPEEEQKKEKKVETFLIEEAFDNEQNKREEEVIIEQEPEQSNIPEKIVTTFDEDYDRLIYNNIGKKVDSKEKVEKVEVSQIALETLKNLCQNPENRIRKKIDLFKTILQDNDDKRESYQLDINLKEIKNLPNIDLINSEEKNYPIKKVYNSLKLFSSQLLTTIYTKKQIPKNISAVIIINCSFLINDYNRSFFMLIICGLTCALNCLSIPYAVLLVGDVNFTYLIKNYEEKHSIKVLQRIFECMMINRYLNKTVNSINYAINDDLKHPDKDQRAIFMFTDGLDEDFLFPKLWEKNLFNNSNNSFGFIFGNQNEESDNQFLNSIWEKFQRYTSVRRKIRYIQIPKIDLNKNTKLITNFLKRFTDMFEYLINSNYNEYQDNGTYSSDCKLREIEHLNELKEEAENYSFYNKSDKMFVLSKSKVKKRKNKKQKGKKNNYKNAIDIVSMNKEIRDLVKEYIQKYLLKSNELIEISKYSNSIFSHNKASQKVLSTSGSEIDFSALLLYLINPGPEPLIYLEEKGGLVRNYSVTIIIDSSYSCFNEINRLHSFKTIQFFLSSFASLDIQSIDIIIAKNSPIVICKGLKSNKAFSSSSIVLEQLLTLINDNPPKVKLSEAISCALDFNNSNTNELTRFFFILTDGFYNEEDKKKISDIIEECEIFDIQCFGIGLGIFPNQIEDIFHNCIFSPEPSNLWKALGYFFKIGNPDLVDKIPQPRVISDGEFESEITNLNQIEETKDFKFNKLTKELNDTEILQETFTFINKEDEDISKMDLEDPNIYNQPGDDKAIYKKDYLKGHKILIVMLWDCSLSEHEEKLVSPEFIIKSSNKENDYILRAVAYFGIEITIVQNYGEAIKEITKPTSDGRCEYYAVWVFCGPPNEILPKQNEIIKERRGKNYNYDKRDANPHLIGQFLEVLNIFWKKKGSLVFFAEGSPLTYQVNEFLKIAEFPDENNYKKKVNFRIGGEHLGKGILKRNEEGNPRKLEFNAKQMKFKNIQRPSISHNLVKIFEGKTISYVQIESSGNLDPFIKFSVDSESGISSLFYPRDENRGDIFIDCGYTKFFTDMSSSQKKSSDGTFRYIQNIAAWTYGKETHIFEKNNEENQWKPQAFKYTIDYNKKWTKFIKPIDIKNMTTLFAIDSSGSINDKYYYFIELQKIVNEYSSNKKNIFYEWNTKYKKIENINDFISNRMGRGGTYSHLIALIANKILKRPKDQKEQKEKKDETHNYNNLEQIIEMIENEDEKIKIEEKDQVEEIEHLVIVTDGQTEQESVDLSTNLIKRYKLKFKYVTTFLIGNKDLDLSVGCPYCRESPNETYLISSRGEKSKINVLTREDTKAYEEIDHIYNYEEFMNKFNNLKTVITAKSLGTRGDLEIKFKIEKLYSRIKSNISNKQWEEFNRKIEELKKIAIEGSLNYSIIFAAGIKDDDVKENKKNENADSKEIVQRRKVNKIKKNFY